MNCTHGKARTDLTTLDNCDVEDIEEHRKRHQKLGRPCLPRCRPLKDGRDGLLKRVGIEWLT